MVLSIIPPHGQTPVGITTEASVLDEWGVRFSHTYRAGYFLKWSTVTLEVLICLKHLYTAFL